MGMCKSCGEVYATVDLTDGICQKCIIKSEENKEFNAEKEKEMLKSSALVAERNRIKDEYMKRNEKSMTVALLLTFFFGPFGKLYTSVLGGIIWIIVFIVAFSLAWPFATVVSLLAFITTFWEIPDYHQKISEKYDADLKTQEDNLNTIMATRVIDTGKDFPSGA